MSGGGAGDWGPWVAHDGRGCPLQAGLVIHVVEEHGRGGLLPCGTLLEGEIRVDDAVRQHPAWCWDNFGRARTYGGARGICGRVLRYRIRRPRALQQLIDRAAAPPAPGRQPEPA